MSQIHTYDGFKDLTMGGFFVIQLDPVPTMDYSKFTSPGAHMQWLCRKERNDTYKIVATATYAEDRPDSLVVSSRAVRNNPSGPLHLNTVGEEHSIPLLEGMQVITDKEQVRRSAVGMTRELAKQYPTPEHRDSFVRWMFMVGDSNVVIADPELRTSLAQELSAIYSDGVHSREKERVIEPEPIRG